MAIEPVGRRKRSSQNKINTQTLALEPTKFSGRTLRPHRPERQKELEMAKQFAKGFAMVLMVVGVALVTAVAANAQNRVAADIQFEFMVGDKVLPAGSYIVSPASSGGDALMIRSRDSKKSAIRLTNSVQAKLNKTNPRLVFHRYGQNYFLAQVWTGDSTGRQLTKSHKEKSIQQELRAIAPKTNPDAYGYEIVVVAASLR
jgi:hypothetical protein